MLGMPGEWVPSGRLLATVRLARYVKRPLSRRGAYQLHLGSGAWAVRLVIAGQLEDEVVAVLRPERPVPVQMGDRFVLRDVGRRLIVAGGRIIEPIAPRKGRDARRAAALLRPTLDRGVSDRATALLAWRGIEQPEVLAAHSGGGIPSGAISAGGMLMAPGHAVRLADEARLVTAEFHAGSPLRPGIPKASLGSRLGIGDEVLAAVLGLANGLEQRGSMVALQDFAATLSGADEVEWRRVRDALEADGPMVPRLKELDLHPELLHALLREERLVRISHDLVYLPDQLDELLKRLAEMPSRFTVAAFRDTIGLTRKYAIPLLEWMDRHGATVRIGDERSVGDRVRIGAPAGGNISPSV